MKINKKKNALRGTFWGMVLKVIQILFPFILRTIFIRSIGIEYLGLDSLFASILKVLNLAELGVSSALVYSMYRPIADNDKQKMCQLMNLYRLYYRIIGVIILIIGVLLVPFLPHLVKGNIPSDMNLYILYAMNLVATVLSYWLFAYRSSLFVAHQRNDVISIVTIIVNICVYSLQAASVLFARNYYLYLMLAIFGQVAINTITAVVSIKIYPDYNPCGKLPEKERKEINHKVRDLFTAKVGGVINHSADSIVISALIGLEMLAIYQNYYYIISSIMAIFTIFFNACLAGIGNSLITNKKANNKKLLYNLNHIVFMGISFCCSCFICACQPFIKLWVGNDYKLDFSYVILFAIYLFAEEAPRTLIVFKDAGGIWKHDRFRPLITAGVNMALNLFLTPMIGLYGIILSTIVSLLLIAYPWLIININNRLFHIDVKKYVKRIFAYCIAIAVSSFASYKISYVFSVDNLLITLIARTIIAALISIISFIVIFFKTEENEYMLQQIVTIWNRIRKKTREG